MSADEQEYENPADVPVPPAVTDELFLEWRSPRFGRTNPEQLNNPVWEWLIRTRLNAYWANKKLNGPDSCAAGPVWCFERFGQSRTVLPDGREILIAGEHEDSYDADFYIYNDVVVRHPSGAIDIYGYPKEVFPPTDFHSATLLGDKILLIGSTGYLGERKIGTTQVLLLDLPTLQISSVQTSGVSPGWLRKHHAVLSDDARSILVTGGEVETNSFVENIDDWKLHLADWRWERLTARQWPRWKIVRNDQRPNSIWKLSSAVLYSDIPSLAPLFSKMMGELTAEYGKSPDLSVARTLYRPPIPHEVLPDDEKNHRVHRIRVNGVIVRYVEDTHSLQITIEGDLDDTTAEALTKDLLWKISTLENCDYEMIQI